jgi:YVTN family beta-propeller protein
LKFKLLIWRPGAAIVATALAIAVTMPADAGAIPLGSFQQFGFSDAGIPATGCDPADPAGPFCFPSGGTPTTFLTAPPWTFVAPIQGVILTVTDAFTSGERFQVFDFGASLGLTSAPVLGADCGDDPVPCLSTAGISKGLFHLNSGNHSITIIPTISPDGGGSGYLSADPVPEPMTSALLAAGLAAVAFLRRRLTAGSWKVHLRPRKWMVVIPAAGFAVAVAGWFGQRPVAAQGPTRFVGPTSSQTLALPADDSFVAVVNPDNNSVTFFDVRLDRNRRLAEVPVQTEPNGVAVLPDGSKAYVANTVSGTVTVIPLHIANGIISKPTKHIPAGTEPYGLALTPNGTRLYVSNSRSNTVSVIDTSTDTVIQTIQNVGPEPRGIAITNDGDADDADETVYVTQFLSLPVAGKVDGQDDAKAGHVTIISTATNLVTGQVTINPLADTGFNANGDAIARIPIGPNAIFPTGAYPNQLNNIAIKGNFAFVPNVGASPNGPVLFNVNTQSLLSVINRLTASDAGSINMHLPVQNQTNPNKLFNTIPWAAAFKHASNEGYVVIAASNVIVKVLVDPATGVPAVQNDPLDPTRVLQVKVGKNPRGIVINSADTRAYVMNYVSRDLSVLKLDGPEQVIDTRFSANLPAPGTLADTIQVGKELYNTSVGEFDPATSGGPAIVGRMSRNGWGACAACHPNGLSDDVVWIFPSGPKRTIPQHTDFDLTDPTRNTMRPLNFSAERDEEEDFELNIRAVSGGLGMIVLADGTTQDTDVNNFTPRANGGRNQLKVRGVNGWDAIKAYIQFGVRPPISPVSKTSPDVIAGRALFTAANCQQCHGSAQWTTARVRFTPPPVAGIVDAGGEILGELRSVGTFNPAALNEVRQNAAAPLGANGYVPPSLLSLFAFPQTFFHNGSAASLDEVLDNVTHRSAGTAGVDTLANPADRARIVQFLLSIDAASAPIP